jgi:hypothetical protein
MTGIRLADAFDETQPIPFGAYWRESNGTWSVRTPNGRIGSVAKHTVVEHEDGTITVSPSILVYAIEPRIYTPEERARMVMLADEAYVREWESGKPGYHGFLERGVWRDC